LEKLVVFKNQLTSLPPEIGELVNLEKLYVSSNQLTSLPSDIGKLVNLEIFCFWQSTDFSSF
jgi:Leucine-rich repeat (LRR) protein